MHGELDRQPGCCRSRHGEVGEIGGIRRGRSEDRPSTGGEELVETPHNSAMYQNQEALFGFLGGVVVQGRRAKGPRVRRGIRKCVVP